MDVVGALSVIVGIGSAVSADGAGTWLIAYGAVLGIGSIWVYRVHHRIRDQDELVQPGPDQEGANGGGPDR
jgi:hypothetical protein